MAKKPFFSIIIPALNEARYLPRLLQDLTNQTYRDFEVVVVDGGSRDKTVALALSYKDKLPKLTLLTSPRAHVCTQRNLGAKHALADTLIFSDADNSIPPYFLQGVKYRAEQDEADLLYFWLKPDVKNPQNDAIATAINTFLELQNNLKPTYLLESLFVIKKNVFDDIHGFDESINYAEGKSLIQQTLNHGYSAKMHRDPTYSYSFRRIRKYGALGVAGRIARVELAELFGIDYHSQQAKKLYPMLGGAYFNKPLKVKNKFLKNIRKLLKDL